MDSRRLAPILAAVFVLLSACQQQDQAAGGADTTAATGGGSSAGQANADVAFVDSMVPHHEMAMHMADMVLEHGSSPEVKALAQRLKEKQAAEVGQMKTARQELAGSDATPAMQMDGPMQASMDSMMTLHAEQMDQAFLRQMIPHHQQGIEMAQQARPNLTRPELQTIAQKIIDDQQREIEEMRRLQSQ